MAIQETINALASALDKFEAGREAILKNDSYAQTYKANMLQAFTDQAKTTIEGLAKRLWGDLVYGNGLGVTLSAEGEIWATMERLDQQLAEAKNRAATAGIDGNLFQHAKMRADSIVSMLASISDLKEAYKAATSDEQRALEDYAGLLLPGRFGHVDALEVNKAIRWLNAKREARLATPAVARIQAEIDTLIQDLIPQAEKVTQRAANVLAAGWASTTISGVGGSYLSRIPAHYKRTSERVYDERNGIAFEVSYERIERATPLATSEKSVRFRF